MKRAFAELKAEHGSAQCCGAVRAGKSEWFGEMEMGLMCGACSCLPLPRRRCGRDAEHSRDGTCCPAAGPGAALWPGEGGCCILVTPVMLPAIPRAVAPSAGKENHHDFGQKQDLGVLPRDR